MYVCLFECVQPLASLLTGYDFGEIISQRIVCMFNEIGWVNIDRTMFVQASSRVQRPESFALKPAVVCG